MLAGLLRRRAGHATPRHEPGAARPARGAHLSGAAAAARGCRLSRSSSLACGKRRRSRLFVDRAREARADFELSEENAEAVAELCRRLDGLPLALELAAARIKLLSPRAILERLGGRLELLKAAPGAGLPARHRTLRAAVDWSYDLLAAEEQALFTSLAVFVGGFSLDGAAAVAGDVELDVVDGVESLLNNSLLRTEPHVERRAPLRNARDDAGVRARAAGRAR